MNLFWPAPFGVYFHAMSEAGQEVIHVHREPGLGWGAQREVFERRECPAEGLGHPWQYLLLRLWTTRASLGQHQSGHHPLYTVLWYSQVKCYESLCHKQLEKLEKYMKSGTQGIYTFETN